MCLIRLISPVFFSPGTLRHQRHRRRANPFLPRQDRAHHRWPGSRRRLCLYACTLAHHLGKHILGNPAIVVENMTGAGSIIAANHLYKFAKPDGLTRATTWAASLQQLLGKPGIEFDALKFKYIGRE